LGGAPLVTFVVAIAGAGLAHVALACRPLRWRQLVTGAAVLGLVPLLGLVLAWPLRPPPAGAGRTLTVAVVQGGLPDLALQFESRAQQVLDNHVRETLRLAAQIRSGATPRPDLVIWPENSSDVDPYLNRSAYDKITGAVHAVNVPVLVGAILQGPGANHRRNVGILWSPTSGPGAQYTKRHPVPFGEYIPLRPLAQWVSSDAKTVTDMVAGHGNGLLRGGPVPLGDVICFEVAYDGLVRSSVAAGAQLLVVQTNNATFGHTAETYQQLAMAQLRAVETARTVVQAATTGKSAIIGPDGTVRDESGALFSSGILVGRVPVRSTQTLATRVGAAPEYALSALAVLGVAFVVIRERRGRRGGGDRASSLDSPREEMVEA
ncbi:MAG TPA: apolipoprotein N-acyltransferase, partial [Jatrophihabitans sp.]|nr:apolipoprotein N-acyltransferase [Jatrophihabitans sp.]